MSMPCNLNGSINLRLWVVIILHRCRDLIDKVKEATLRIV